MFTEHNFRKAGWITCFSIFLLVLFGGIVRATGSGMGCPDWPKCFGKYIPPTHLDQLPENYENYFLEKRLKKVSKYVKLLKAIGLNKQADAIANDPKIAEPEAFSVSSTWIEYLNRLFGALTGLFALATFVLSFQFIKKKTKIFICTFIGIIVILFNAWLGSIVVATNLLPGVVTLHYLAAFLAVGLFMWPLTNGLNGFGVTKKWPLLIITCFVLILIQTVTGTWSREVADGLIKSNNLITKDATFNIHAMGIIFTIHRYLALLILGIFIYIYYKNKMTAQKKQIFWICILIISQIIAGSINIWFILPPIAQTYHIFAGGIILGIAMHLSIQIFKTKALWQ